MGDDTAQSVGAVRRTEIDVKNSGVGLMLNVGNGDSFVLENKNADKKLEWKKPVVRETDSDLRRSAAASLVSLETPGRKM